eukprot:TRINITY_DN2434_c0_g4_i1.p1 TRINITY_DN2434_c0_g4~~TRINITY_DN2434_c0_g4_i1.p1  ORF type:complete len:748 (-),score=144.23 TRINITY_DN2434_c0_g4_i1:36-2279(-)
MASRAHQVWENPGPSLPGSMPDDQAICMDVRSIVTDCIQSEMPGAFEKSFAIQRAWLEDRLTKHEDSIARLLQLSGGAATSGATSFGGNVRQHEEDSSQPSQSTCDVVGVSEARLRKYSIKRDSTKDLISDDLMLPILPVHHEPMSDQEQEVHDLVSKLEDMFDQLDVDGSGTINRLELRKAFADKGVPVMPAVQAFVDNSSNMEIDRLEWLHMVEDASSEDVNAFIAFARRLIDVSSEQGSLTGTSRMWRWRTRCVNFTIIHHDSMFRMAWDIIIMVLLFIVFIYLPFTFGFGSEASEEITWLDTSERIFDTIFLVDVLLNFRTTYIDDNEVIVTNGRKMACHYLRTWFSLDLASSVPWDTITAGLLPSLQPVRLLKVGKIAKVLKLLRMGKMMKVMAGSQLVEVMEDYFPSKFRQFASRMLSILLLTVLACHWLACFLGVFDEGGINKYLSLESPSLGERYIAALYWAVMTLTTVGYGDIIPTTVQERLYVMFAMMIGSAFFGYVIGCITSVITDMDIDRRTFNERMEVVQAWLDFHERMPAILRRRIRRHFKEHYRNRSIADDATIVAELSGMLRADTAYFIIHECVRTNPTFRVLPSTALANVVCVVKKFLAKKAESIVIAGDPGTSMYVIISGRAHVTEGTRWLPLDCTGTIKLSNELEEGDSFGEEVLFSLEMTYQYTVEAKSSMLMHEVDVDAFKHQFRNMPELVQKMHANFVKSRRLILMTSRSRRKMLEGMSDGEPYE